MPVQSNSMTEYYAELVDGYGKLPIEISLELLEDAQPTIISVR